MKYLVLGLFSLTLLGFVCAQQQNGNSASSNTTAMAYNNTSNTTWPSNNNTTNSSNNSSTVTNPTGSQSTTTTSMTGSRPTMPTGTTTVTAVSGQSHIFTSVSLLLGSFALHVLWQ